MNDILTTKLGIIEENFILPSDFIYDKNKMYSIDFISKYSLRDNKNVLFSEYDRNELVDKINFHINSIFQNKCNTKIKTETFYSDKHELDILYFRVKFPEMIESDLSMISNYDVIFGVQNLRTLKMLVDGNHRCVYLIGSIYIQMPELIDRYQLM